jgi:uncharacterized protein YycO
VSALRLIFTRTRSLGAVVIRAGAWWGQWSHCGLVLPGGHVVESLALKGGVITTMVDAVIFRSSAHQVLDLPCPAPQYAHEWALSTVGMPYDWGGVLGIPFRSRDWQAPGRWYCSEHCAAAIERAGLTLVRPGVHGIHPDTLHALAWAAGARP